MFQFQLSWKQHALHLAAVPVLIGLLRIQVIQSAVTSLLLLLPQGFYATKYAAGHFDPLSALGWIVHVTTIIPNLEIILACWKRSKTEESSTRNVYTILTANFALSHLHGICTLLSHSMIGVNPTLEVALLNFEFICMRLHVFAYGGLLWFGWWTIPPLVALILSDTLLFHTPAGIVASTLSMAAVVLEASLSSTFKIGWIFLALLPMLFPDSSNDFGHTIGATMVNLPLLILFHALTRESNKKVVDQPHQPKRTATHA